MLQLKNLIKFKKLKKLKYFKNHLLILIFLNKINFGTLKIKNQLIFLNFFIYSESKINQASNGQNI